MAYCETRGTMQMQKMVKVKGRRTNAQGGYVNRSKLHPAKRGPFLQGSSSDSSSTFSCSASSPPEPSSARPSLSVKCPAHIISRDPYQPHENLVLHRKWLLYLSTISPRSRSCTRTRPLCRTMRAHIPAIHPRPLYHYSRCRLHCQCRQQLAIRRRWGRWRHSPRSWSRAL
jgi:hypothetical protein